MFLVLGVAKVSQCFLTENLYDKFSVTGPRDNILFMDKLNSVLVFLCTLSIALIAIFSGAGSATGSVPIGNTGVSLHATNTLPLILAIVWLLAWHRFIVLSLHENKPQIDKLILARINESEFVRKVFNSKHFGFPGPVGTSKWGWPDPQIPNGSPGNFVYYHDPFPISMPG